MANLPNDTVKTIGEHGRRVWLYPEWLRGRFMTARTIAHWVLLVMLLVGPWIEIGGHPAIRIDIPARRMYLWGLTFFATDGSYLLFFFGFLLFSVFLVTALFGRSWCGWACPQTVFLESLIRPLERLIEGSANQRRKLDKAPWTTAKVVRKALKYTAFAVVAGAVGTTFTAYFLGAEGTFQAQLDPLAHPSGTVTFVFITALLMFDFSWFREQTCLVVCPYGRFQSVLLDDNSLAVVYDIRRGEPRGKKSAEGVGDCVDCGKCVNVCPTGADIRVGIQMECTQCMACIDACDDIMHKLGRKPGLIRFGSQNTIEGKPTRIVRTRAVAYAVGLGTVATAFVLTVSARQPVELGVSRQVGAPYVATPDGQVQNPLRLRISNKSDEARAFTLTAVEPADLTLVIPIIPFVVEGGQVTHMPFVAVRSRQNVTSRTETITLRVRDDQGFSEDVRTEFLFQGKAP